MYLHVIFGISDEQIKSVANFVAPQKKLRRLHQKLRQNENTYACHRKCCPSVLIFVATYCHINVRLRQELALFDDFSSLGFLRARENRLD